LRDFLAIQLNAHRTASTASSLASALRSYFRYRTTCGDLVGALTAVISTPAHWRLTTLPRALKPDESRRLLNAFVSIHRWPKRGYAIVRCGLDLGLRRRGSHDQPITSAAVQKVIKRACRRCGLMHSSSHALRHTLACRLVENGSSLKEVADVLRHRSLNTTLIYAKLDTPKLSAVPLPWPGSRS
jgi:site-specific recombinase XerD